MTNGLAIRLYIFLGITNSFKAEKIDVHKLHEVVIFLLSRISLETMMGAGMCSGIYQIDNSRVSIVCSCC